MGPDDDFAAESLPPIPSRRGIEHKARQRRALVVGFDHGECHMCGVDAGHVLGRTDLTLEIERLRRCSSGGYGEDAGDKQMLWSGSPVWIWAVRAPYVNKTPPARENFQQRANPFPRISACPQAVFTLEACDLSHQQAIPAITSGLILAQIVVKRVIGRHAEPSAPAGRGMTLLPGLNMICCPDQYKN